jgi:hypothetical protein
MARSAYLHVLSLMEPDKEAFRFSSQALGMVPTKTSSCKPFG